MCSLNGCRCRSIRVWCHSSRVPYSLSVYLCYVLHCPRPPSKSKLCLTFAPLPSLPPIPPFYLLAQLSRNKDDVMGMWGDWKRKKGEHDMEKEFEQLVPICTSTLLQGTPGRESKQVCKITKYLQPWTDFRHRDVIFVIVKSFSQNFHNIPQPSCSV